jgi:hypothetical protein
MSSVATILVQSIDNLHHLADQATVGGDGCIARNKLSVNSKELLLDLALHGRVQIIS